jgi:hypothetical protein
MLSTPSCATIGLLREARRRCVEDPILVAPESAASTRPSTA